MGCPFFIFCGMIVPIFPLGVVLCPEQVLPLHIFEDRYKRMVRDSLENDSLFAIVNSVDSELRDVACLARIQSVITEYDDGRFDILVLGETKVAISDIEDREGLLHARINHLEDESSNSMEDVSKLIALHMRFQEFKGATIVPQIYNQVRFPSYYIAGSSGLSHSTRQRILEMRSESKRQEFLFEYLVPVVQKLEQSARDQKKVKTNGHFKSNGQGPHK